MFLGEAFEALSKNLESDPTNYEEAMVDNDSIHWVKAMKLRWSLWTPIKSGNL